MLRQRDGVDLHTLLKAAYFADRESLNRHARPVFGATRQAMTCGPVPLQLHEMLKEEACRPAGEIDTSARAAAAAAIAASPRLSPIQKAALAASLAGTW